jgi:SAM-dependent methyltransferase
MSTSVGWRCHLCGSPALEEASGFRELRRVTSDCQPWPAGGGMGVCRSCATVQNILDQGWREDVEKIYEGYAIYHQSGGAEQAVFDSTSGRPAPRSARVLDWLAAHGAQPPLGRLLDIGCGNGPLLREFGWRAPGWTLAGTEFNGKYRAEVERLPGVTALYTCPVEEVPGMFTLITLMHVLEHIPEPVRFLRAVRDKLDAGGFLAVEVPDARQNPFDLLIADHCTHFTAATLAALLRRAGYEVAALATDWVPKEISLLARKAGAAEPGSRPGDGYRAAEAPGRLAARRRDRRARAIPPRAFRALRHFHRRHLAVR